VDEINTSIGSEMPGVATKVGHGLAKVLAIKLDEQRERDDEIRRGESVFSSQTADAYVEQEPHTIDWFREITPSGKDIGQYFVSLFPFMNWIGRYNLQWFIGDLVAG
jgi:sodium-independent sulfate anion transporter 11